MTVSIIIHCVIYIPTWQYLHHSISTCRDDLPGAVVLLLHHLHLPRPPHLCAHPPEAEAHRAPQDYQHAGSSETSRRWRWHWKSSTQWCDHKSGYSDWNSFVFYYDWLFCHIQYLFLTHSLCLGTKLTRCPIRCKIIKRRFIMIDCPSQWCLWDYQTDFFLNYLPHVKVAVLLSVISNQYS